MDGQKDLISRYLWRIVPDDGALGSNPLARLTRKSETDPLLVAGDEITAGGPGDCGSSALRRRTVAGVAEALQGTDIYFQR